MGKRWCVEAGGNEEMAVIRIGGLWIAAIIGLAVMYFQDLRADRKERIWKR